MPRPVDGSGRRRRHRHRLAGLLIALPVIVIVVTGIILNHAYDLRLSERMIPSWLAGLYHGSEPDVRGFLISGLWVYQISGEIYVGRQPAGYCAERLVGAVPWQGNLVVACESSLWLMTAEGEVIEQLSAVHGVPQDLTAMVVENDKLMLENTQGWFSAAADLLGFDPVSEAPASDSRPLQRVPDEALLEEAVSWQQFLTDLHTGRIVGSAGVWLSDIAALLLLFMVYSGCRIWWRSK
ncbi:MAG: PepSY domain-containing protein [Pseudomonadales bacterium]|nr:PepSY domain-containing protein [Pseudomonadales bacterium]